MKASAPVAAEYYTARELASLFKIPISTFWRYIKLGWLPKPVKVAPRCSRWPAGEVAALQRQLLEDRGGAQ